MIFIIVVVVHRGDIVILTILSLVFFCLLMFVMAVVVVGVVVVDVGVVVSVVDTVVFLFYTFSNRKFLDTLFYV